MPRVPQSEDLPLRAIKASFLTHEPCQKLPLVEDNPGDAGLVGGVGEISTPDDGSPVHAVRLGQARVRGGNVLI